MLSQCDKCGDTIDDIDAGFSPGTHKLEHGGCGGVWHQIRQTWIICHNDRLPELGTNIILHEESVDHEDGSGHTDSCAPYVATVLDYGAYYSNQPMGESGRYVLCREVPDGAARARQHYENVAHSAD